MSARGYHTAGQAKRPGRECNGRFAAQSVKAIIRKTEQSIAVLDELIAEEECRMASNPSITPAALHYYTEQRTLRLSELALYQSEVSR